MLDIKKLMPYVTFGAVMLTLSASFDAVASERKLDSHAHGISELKIAQEGSSFEFELEAPGNDIIGFEHAAKNAAQKAQIAAALKILGAPGQLFRTPAAAGCTISDAEAEFETSDDHAGFHVHWSMTCANPGKMTMLKILYFDAFAAAEEIEVEAIGKAGQSAIEVEKDMRQVDLTGAFGD